MTGRPPIAKQRDAAYRLIARAMLGEPWPDQLEAGTLQYAFDLVLDDHRKSRTKAERAIQMHLALHPLIVRLAHLGPAGAAAESERLLRGIVGAALGEEVDP